MEINLDKCIQLNDELLKLCKELNGKRFLGRRGIVRTTAKVIEALSYYQQISYALVRMGGQHDKGDAEG